jgi:hypothetical protein
LRRRGRVRVLEEESFLFGFHTHAPRRPVSSLFPATVRARGRSGGQKPPPQLTFFFLPVAMVGGAGRVRAEVCGACERKGARTGVRALSFLSVCRAPGCASDQAPRACCVGGCEEGGRALAERWCVRLTLRGSVRARGCVCRSGANRRQSEKNKRRRSLFTPRFGASVVRSHTQPLPPPCSL